jgi:hypothetical protein
MWLIVINLQSVNALMNNPAVQLSLKESGDFQPWQISQDVVDTLTDSAYQSNTQNLIGCVFAQEVTMPGESISISQESLKWGGFQTPAVALNRNSFEKLKITFLETNASFCDLVIRPWITLVGHHGLVARARNSEKNVKCDFLDVIQFTRNGPFSSPIINKILRYYDVVPVSMDGLTLTRLEENLKRRSASFIYNGYSVMDVGAGG